MAIDLDEISRRIDEALKSPESIEYFDRIKRRQKIQARQIKRFHTKYAKKLDWVIKKLEDKYSSNTYKDKEYKMGREPRDPLYWFLIEYARKYCRECKNKKYWNIFTGEAYYIGSYVIQVMNGQGSAVKIEKK